MKNLKKFFAFAIVIAVFAGFGYEKGVIVVNANEALPATSITPVPEPMVTGIPYHSFTKEYTEERYGIGTSKNSVDGADAVTKYSFRKEAEIPYFVGREDKTATNFARNNQHDAVLYLGKPMYLTTAMKEEVYYVTVSDETVAKIDGAELVPLKQGNFILTTYDKNGQKLEDIKYVVTTYNDSRTSAEIVKNITFPMNLTGDIYRFGLNKDLEYWETHCSTLMDVSLYFQGRGFYYSSEGEPEINCLNGDPLEDWMWNNSVETVFECNKGVCLQAAQMAVHLLANDFEDWGVVMIDGNQGHIFNWFYEDETYYVFDYTEVISYNAWERNSGAYKDFSNNVKVFNSYEDMTKWITTSGKVNLDQNYLIYQYSLQGYDTLPANINTAKYSSRDALAGKYKEIVICFQDVFMNGLKPIYIKDGVNIRFQPVSLEDMPSRLPHGVFGNKEEYKYYYDYQSK